ncbi:MAG: hemerythrin family protein [Gallionella sp.]|nr:hemerythrin family protein [Gallionella sp.]
MTPIWRLDWDESLSVCIPEIDAEHRHFMQLINELNEAIVGRMGMAQIKSCMQAVIYDAEAHFAHEEALFREWDYPETEQHMSRHAEIIQALHEIMGRFEHDGLEYELIEAGLAVKAALIEHLLTEDMKYRDYCLVSGNRCGTDA